MIKEQIIYQQVTRSFNKTKDTYKSRKIQCFNDDWCYTDKQLHKPVDFNFNDTDWIKVNLPHDYSIEGDFSPDNPSGSSGGFVRTGVLWYRKKFSGKEFKDRKTFLNFDGISANCEIWLNGNLIAAHPYGYTPIHIDITNYITDENIIAVKADTSLQPFARFYQGTGIYRNVELVCTNLIHIDKWGVTYEYKGNGEIQINTNVRVAAYKETVWNDFGTAPNIKEEKECEMVTYIIDIDGNIICESKTKVVIPEFSKHTFVQNLKLENPKLWSEKTPDIYYIHSKLIINDELIDDEVTPIGLRTITYSSSDGLKINGDTVKLKGVCIHQDCGVFGASVPVKAWVKKLCILKNMGVNAIRTSHHPFAKEFYHICDIIGIYVMDEAFDEWKKGWSRDYSENAYGKNRYGYYQYFEQWSETDVKLMVKRDRNNPCVIMWSLGNEIPDFYYNEGANDLKKLVRYCKEEDLTRPVTIGAEGQFRLPIADGIMSNLDIAGYNYVNIKHPDYYEKLHEENPDLIFVSSETFFEPEHWEFILNHNYAIGQFLWSGFDYLGECYYNNPINDLNIDFSNIKDINNPNYGGVGAGNARCNKFLHGWISGMIDITDNPKNQYYYHQSLWQDEPVIHIGVKMYEWENLLWKLIPSADLWNFKNGEVKTVYCFTNCEKVKLFLNDKVVFEGSKKGIYPFEIPVIYEDGYLTAIGYNNGEKVSCHSLKTVKAPIKLLAQNNYPTILADGKDLCEISFSVADENGNTVICKKRIDFELIGDGEIFRVGNGSNNNFESYKNTWIETFNGKAIAIVKAGKAKGTLLLKANTDGLEQLTVEIIAE